MKRMRSFLLNLSFAVISLLLIDGGKVFLIIGTGVQFLTISEHDRDLELPHHHQLGAISECDKWFEQDNDQKIFNSAPPSDYVYNKNIKSQDFIITIWEPPRSC